MWLLDFVGRCLLGTFVTVLCCTGGLLTCKPPVSGMAGLVANPLARGTHVHWVLGQAAVFALLGCRGRVACASAAPQPILPPSLPQLL